MKYSRRFIKLFLAMPVFAFGAALSIQSGIGVNAWDTFALGVANVLPLRYGTVVLLTGIIVLLVDLFMKQSIGIGTLADIFIIGKTTDLILAFNIIPKIESLPIAIICLVTSLFIQCFGVYLYSSAGLSVGPRDAMMIALAKKFNHLSIGMIKGIIEGTVFVIGFLLGAPVGIGTVISVFGIGFILEFTLKLFHFDLRNVSQENLMQTSSHLYTLTKQKVSNETL
ncbi:YczE/YyaS/YitT family protein [Candidatus Stoquefichus massiliensis]|uniref:YczE/YyaS/YitT family protein n=1 Tax=Candidatus Stoquefichus massiliensis TaxID=1470350 RepID=UPI000489A728|nr:hypothetical protein [Candidatus Stoquefichus massiliensis]